jgi:hypothetical protein
MASRMLLLIIIIIIIIKGKGEDIPVTGRAGP